MLSEQQNQPNQPVASVNQVAIDIPSPTSSNPVYYEIFLFANPKSGNQSARQLVGLETELIKFRLHREKGGVQKVYQTEVYIFDLTIAAERNEGFTKLAEKSKQGFNLIRVICCGGDGTISWVLEEMLQKGVNLDRSPICAMPFGSGNDHANVMGWGVAAPIPPLGSQLSTLKHLIVDWVDAKIVDFDIWEVHFEVEEDGGDIRRVASNSLKESIGTKKYTKKMANYCSFGVDARIGLGFDKSRSGSRIWNKVIYAWEGLKKMFTSTRRVNEVVASVATLGSDASNNPISAVEVGQRVLFDTSKGGPNQQGTRLQGTPVTLLALNIQSYAAGANPWVSGRGKTGLVGADGRPIPDNFQPQSSSDGKLELISFGSTVGLGASRFIDGLSSRVDQSAGPFNFKFKPTDENGRNIVTYLQVDGEYLQLIKPKSLVISKIRDTPNGKIKMLTKQHHA